MPDSERDDARPPAMERLFDASLSDAPSFLLARANARALSLGNAALAPLKLKVRSYAVLALAAGSERPSQRELAQFLRLDPSQVVALVDDLEAQRLVERATDKADRRTKVIAATALGLEREREARMALDRADVEIFRSLTAAQRATLATLLRSVAFDD